MQVFQGIDLFSGAGGLSLGAIDAGIDVKVAIDKNSFAASTYHHNLPEVKMINSDIKNIDIEKVRHHIDQKLVLFGGPPCQGFSVSNSRTRNFKNPNNWLYKEFIRFIEHLNPEWVVIENVSGIKETEGGVFFDNILHELNILGFQVFYALLNASDYGVPQKRNRFFIVANRIGLEYNFPHKIKKRITVSEAIEDLPLVGNGNTIDQLRYSKNEQVSEYAKLLRNSAQSCSNNLVTRNSETIITRYKHVPQGGNWQNIPKELMQNYADRNRCHTGIYHRLLANQPSKVIGNFRKNMLIHPFEDRGLSVREAARLQSFPDRYIFQGSIGYQQQQVADAVPPLLAKKVFEEILNLDGNLE